MNLKSIAMLIAASAILYSCGGTTQEEVQPALTVDFVELAPENTETNKKYPGSIEGVVNVDIKAQVGGYLEQVFVKEGDFVTKGQPLFKIKADVYNEGVNNSKAIYEAALAAEQSAKIELDKIRPLVEGKVYTELQLQTAEVAYLSAKAQVAQAKAMLGSSSINAGFTLIKAPVSGFIGRIPSKVGHLVSAVDMTPLTTLSEISSVNVYFSLSEADFLTYLKANGEGTNEASLLLADGTVYEQQGKVEIASGNINRSTGSTQLKATFLNPDKLLRAGGSGKVILTKKHDNVLLVPMAAVKSIQDRYFVFVLADNATASMKQITVSGKSGTKYILESGLKEGDKIVVNRIDAINEGMEVEATKVEM